MTRTNDLEHEEREARFLTEVARAACGELADGVTRMGGELCGLSAKLDYGDCLLTLRAEFPGGSMVCFVGGTDLGYCLRKATRDANRDALRWKPDRYRVAKIDGD